MFSKGDKIVYPSYGAGIIEDLEKKEIDGAEQLYYVLRIPVGNLKIMVSTRMAESLGVREIYSENEILGIIENANTMPNTMSENWNQRYKDNMEKIKSGKLDEVALVYRNLLLRERERGLSSAEKKMLTSAKQIILSELILSKDIDKVDAEKILKDMFGGAESS
jgi:CarD family transcriptional regulator